MALLPDLIGWGISAIGKLKDKLFKTTKEEVDEEINAQVANEKDPKKRQELAAKLLKERQQLIDKKNKEKNQAWATSGVQSNVPAKVLTEEDKAYQKE
jgi:hypothetical protein